MGKENKKAEEQEVFETTSPLSFFGEIVETSEDFLNQDLETENEEEEEKGKAEEEIEFFPLESPFDVEEEEEQDEEEEEEEDEDEKNEKGQKKNSKSEKVNTINFLAEKGFIELEEDVEVTEENSEEILEASWEKSIDSAIDEMIEDLPERAKNFFRFVSKGGDPDEFLEKMAINVQTGISKNSDREDEKVLEKALRIKYKADGYDDEDIEDQIQALKDAEKFEKIGQKAFDAIIEKQEKEEAEEVNKINKLLKDKKEKEKAFKQRVNNFVAEAKEVKGLSLSVKDKQSLPKYIYEPAVTLDDGRTLTQIQIDFFEAIGSESPEKLVALAKVLNSDFDFSSIKKKAVTEETRENLKKNQQRSEKTSVKETTGSATKKRRDLADRL